MTNSGTTTSLFLAEMTNLDLKLRKFEAIVPSVLKIAHLIRYADENEIIILASILVGNGRQISGYLGLSECQKLRELE